MARIEIRIAEKEKEIIKQLAKKAGFKSYTRYMKTVSLNKEIHSNTDIDTVIQLRKMGNNLNQIARKINIDSSDENIKSLYEEATNLLEVINVTINNVID